MARIDLRVPPKYPEIGDIWEREDGVKFTYTNKGWVK